ncbi:UNVERIFIED_ORG: DNA (cytosine-5)-methyltransferase 1 [Rhizobium esperanzae]
MEHANDNHTGLRFLSVCSGIEAASCAWHPLGWLAVAFSEIEKFPSAVLKHHYPDVPNLGDFTKINVNTLGRVDILAGGTPCQAFSVAGLRQSLADARGNLSLEFVRLAHELAARNGLRNVVWENVVGVLSTKDNAFGCFLAGLVGADSPIEPPARGRWPSAGMVSGPKGRAAWRILDAQYFGVAQRRRRVIVVADFGNGADPAAVLFEQDGVRRYSPPSREAGKDVAAYSASSIGSYRDAEVSGADRAAGGDNGGGSENLVAIASVGNRQSGPLDVATAVNAHGGPHGRLDFESETFVAHVAATLDASYGRLQGASGQDANHGYSQLVAQCVTGNVTHSLTAEGHDASEDGSGRRAPIVACASVADTLTSNGDAHSGYRDDKGLVAVAYAPEISATVAARSSRGGGQTNSPGHNADQQVVVTSAVRRLTPTECERLQGFRDGYTAIPWRGKPSDQCPDGPRYKALGNSWAVPKFAWLGKRIQRFMPNEKPAAANDNDGMRDEKVA